MNFRTRMISFLKDGFYFEKLVHIFHNKNSEVTTIKQTCSHTHNFLLLLFIVSNIFTIFIYFFCQSFLLSEPPTFLKALKCQNKTSAYLSHICKGRFRNTSLYANINEAHNQPVISSATNVLNLITWLRYTKVFDSVPTFKSPLSRFTYEGHQVCIRTLPVIPSLNWRINSGLLGQLWLPSPTKLLT